MDGGSRYSSGKKPDLIRNSFEPIKSENLAKSLRLQQLSYKVSLEQVSQNQEMIVYLVSPGS